MSKERERWHKPPYPVEDMKLCIYIVVLMNIASNALGANLSHENRVLKTEVTSLKEQLRDIKNNKRLKEERGRLQKKLREEEHPNNRDIEKFSNRVKSINRRIDKYNSLNSKNRSVTESQNIALELKKIEEERLKLYKEEVHTKKDFLKWK